MATNSSVRKIKSNSPSGSSDASSLRTLVLLLLPILSLTGAFTTLVLASRNGTANIVKNAIKSSRFPGTSDPLLRTYTGIGFLDHQLTILVTFFAPVVDLRNSDLVLSSTFGLGQFGAGWTLMMMESLRSGNKGKIISFVVIFGLIFQNITFAVTVPIYLLIHLLTSPVAALGGWKHSNNSILVSAVDLWILPLSTTIGYTIPSVLMSLPPALISSSTHQRYIALWQPFPLWAGIIQWSIRGLYNRAASEISEGGRRRPAPRGVSYLSNAKYIYMFILAFCISTHIPVIILALLPHGTIQYSSKLLSQLSQSTLYGVFVPRSPVLGLKFLTLSKGVHNFLVWDLYIGCTAFLLWAVLLHRNATTEGATGGGVSWAKRSWKVFIWTLISGPMGAVTVLLWERDAVVSLKAKQGV